jgi:hypothetical protein
MCGAGANSCCRTRWRFKAFYAKNGGTKWTRKARVLTPRAGLLQILDGRSVFSDILSRNSAHFSKPSSAGHKACPHFVKRYSTFGGTAGRQCGELRHQLPFAEVVG